MLSTIKYKTICTPTFCEGAFIANEPSPTICQIEKKNPVIDGPPPLYSNVLLQFETGGNSRNVMPQGQP
jgi:hypothetical protein